ncbi:MAG: hypothetical protein ACLP1X_20585 [Polyangiaceae bacterium]
MQVARCVAALGLLVVVGGGCQTTYSCPGGCTVGAYAVLELTCRATVTSARLTGPCAPSGDAGAGFGFSCAPVTEVPFSGCKEVHIAATVPGVCHVELTFATGFTYSTDVTFASQTDPEPPGCGQCPQYVGPASQATFIVDNPATACLDAGSDEGADAPTDAPSEAAVCPTDASQSVACNFSGTCAGCRSNAGFECTCSDAGGSGSDGGGTQWQCVDTGFPCMGSP